MQLFAPRNSSPVVHRIEGGIVLRLAVVGVVVKDREDRRRGSRFLLRKRDVGGLGGWCGRERCEGGNASFVDGLQLHLVRSAFGHDVFIKRHVEFRRGRKSDRRGRRGSEPSRFPGRDGLVLPFGKVWCVLRWMRGDLCAMSVGTKSKRRWSSV